MTPEQGARLIAQGDEIIALLKILVEHPVQIVIPPQHQPNEPGPLVGMRPITGRPE